MVLSDFHTHTNLCDGNDTPEHMAKRAAELGFKIFGFSGHGYTHFDTSYCMSEDGTKEYLRRIRLLKEEYADKMQILCGVEFDMYSPADASEFDYVIGSSHYVKVGERYHAVDISKEDFHRLIDRDFDGDFESLAEQYYSEISHIFEHLDADIIGHLDLITKYDEIYHFNKGERYYRAAFAAVDELVKHGKPFEINVGAMTRGYRTTPYPDEKILRYIKDRGGEIIITGDCHSAENLGKYLDTATAFAKRCGFTHRLELTGEGFKRVKL